MLFSFIVFCRRPWRCAFGEVPVRHPFGRPAPLSEDYMEASSLISSLENAKPLPKGKRKPEFVHQEGSPPLQTAQGLSRALGYTRKILKLPEMRHGRREGSTRPFDTGRH